MLNLFNVRLPLLRFIACAGCLSIGPAGAVNGPQVNALELVSPAGLAEVPGDDYGGIGDPLRSQHLHDASTFQELLDLPASARWLIAIAARPDEEVTEPFAEDIPMRLRVSTTKQVNLDFDFEKNDGPDRLTAFDGNYPFHTSVTGPPVGTHPFDYYLSFQQHFNYDPRQGSLLLDWVIPFGSREELRFDGATTDTVTTVTNFGNPNATMATNGYNWVPVELFIFAERGDFDGNLAVDLVDVEQLSEQIRLATGNIRLDVNDDGATNLADLTTWVHDVGHTWFGDANLDQVFSSADLVQVFGAGQYEDLVVGNSRWSSGDWNADGEFSSSDLVTAFQDGGYEAGPRPAALAVPEPRLTAIWLLTAALSAWRHRRQCRATA